MILLPMKRQSLSKRTREGVPQQIIFVSAILTLTGVFLADREDLCGSLYGFHDSLTPTVDSSNFLLNRYIKCGLLLEILWETVR